MKFCYLLRITSKEIHEILKVDYGEPTVTLKTVYKCLDHLVKSTDAIIPRPRFKGPSRTAKNPTHLIKKGKPNIKMLYYYYYYYLEEIVSA